MYRPTQVPSDAAQLPVYLERELRALAQVINGATPVLSLVTSHAEPARLFDGLIVLADGVNWNPGSGAGFYGYRAGAWRFLG